MRPVMPEITRMSKWLLLLIPLAFIFSPVAHFIVIQIASRLLSIVAGPVNIWNTVWIMPSTEDVSGTYRLSEKSRQDALAMDIYISIDSRLTLTADHRMEVFELPAFDRFGKQLNCTYNGAFD
jgi:hypothetical protein